MKKPITVIRNKESRCLWYQRFSLLPRVRPGKRFHRVFFSGLLACLCAIQSTKAEEAPVDFEFAFQFVRLQPEQLSETLDNLIQRYPQHPDLVVGSALKVIPKETTRIVSTSVDIGVPHEVIARLCRQPMPVEQAKELVSALLSENADPEMVTRICLRSVSSEALMQVLVAALTRIDPQLHQEMLRLAFAVIEDRGLDGYTVLVDSLVEGEFLYSSDLEGSGCSGECLRPAAEVLVQTLLEETNIDPGPDLLTEPPSSDS